MGWNFHIVYCDIRTMFFGGIRKMGDGNSKTLKLISIIIGILALLIGIPVMTVLIWLLTIGQDV